MSGQKLSKSGWLHTLLLGIVLLASSAAGAGCQQKGEADCEKPQPDDERCPVQRKKPPAGPKEGQKTGQTTGKSPAAEEPPADVPGLALASLKPAQRKLFWSVVEDQFDPCGKPRSFGETLRAGDREACPVAWMTAKWVVGRVKAGDEKRAIVWGLLERLRREHGKVDFQLAERPRLGPADASVTVVEFYDYACPYCRELEPALVKLRKQFPDVAFVLKQLPLDYHAGAEPAARALLAARAQGKLRALHEALFRVPELGEESVLATAKKLGLDVERLKKDMQSDAVDRILREDLTDADKALVQGTPSFFVNGVEVPFDDLAERIEEVRSSAKAGKKQ